MSELVLEDSVALLRDEFVPFKQSNLSIASSPVLYGLCVYTVFSANWNEEKQQLYLFRLRDHYDRLVRSAKVLGFSDFSKQYEFETFSSLMLELVRKNKVKEDALVRVMVFIDEISAGTRIDGLKIALMAYVYPMGEILPRSGSHVCVSSWTRTADNMIPSRAKVNGSYVNASLMKNEALLNGYDDAIALDSDGHVAEGTVANIFIVRDKTLITPGVHTDILEGLTRNTVKELANDLSINYEERTIDRSELYVADEVMFVGSSARITPILSIDKRSIGDSGAGEITKQLTSEYAAVQHGERERFTHWVTSVY